MSHFQQDSAEPVALAFARIMHPNPVCSFFETQAQDQTSHESSFGFCGLASFQGSKMGALRMFKGGQLRWKP